MTAASSGRLWGVASGLGAGAMWGLVFLAPKFAPEASPLLLLADPTLLGIFEPAQSVRERIDEARHFGFAGICLASRWVAAARPLLPELLKRGEERARAEHLNVLFQAADAEALPFADGTFDAVLSTFGVMFAPDHARSAAEMARVCRPGGRIGLANWTPDSLVGRMFKVLGRHLPPPAGVSSTAR